MARTQLTGTQILDGSVKLQDIDISTPGSALVTKLIAGSGITLSATGVDPGTGEVTITSDASADYNDRQKVETLLWMGM